MMFATVIRPVIRIERPRRRRDGGAVREHAPADR
jgi:hypothetical protein